jgi:hypothetical protein
MVKTTDRSIRRRAAATHAQADDDSVAWTRALSLSGAFLSHLAANPDMQRLVTEMLIAGAAKSPELLASNAPFDEALAGLQTRELSEPDVFSRFFGAGLAAR